jgi:hypothetical protein
MPSIAVQPSQLSGTSSLPFSAYQSPVAYTSSGSAININTNTNLLYLLDPLSNSQDVIHCLNLNFAQLMNFGKWIEFLGCRGQCHGTLMNDLISEKGDTLLHVLIRFIDIKNKKEIVSTTRYVKLYVSLLIFSLLSNAKPIGEEFLNAKNRHDKTFYDLICDKIDKSKLKELTENDISGRPLDVVAEDLLKCNNAIPLLKNIALDKQEPDDITRNQRLTCKKGDTLGHIIIRNMLDQIGKPDLMRHLSLVYEMLCAVCQKYTPKATALLALNLRNIDGDLFTAHLVKAGEHKSIVSARSNNRKRRK